ncbi:MAG: 3-methyl-2-oxobutanoate hydroxymethyltransferase [Clostridia bacterium]|nr:3-methyl-2-oxobutanoate hydroxymethyltransferase [Clostridia bacterium]
MAKEKLTIPQLLAMKQQGRKITMLTAYDYGQAQLVEEAGVDMILVGDSLGMTMLGLPSTVPVTMAEMLHHTKAVVRGAPNTFVIADLPFLSYQVSREEAIRNAGLLVKEGGADAVKLEGGGAMVAVAQAVVQAGIPVQGHLGLTPQTATQLGGYRVQGKEAAQAQAIVQDAKALEEAGCFSLVLECVPMGLAAEITRALSIPVIGIGAGPDCDGQVLVYHDVLGLFRRFVPRFVKQYAQLREPIINAFQTYIQEVREGRFPDEAHSFK